MEQSSVDAILDIKGFDEGSKVAFDIHVILIDLASSIAEANQLRLPSAAESS